VTYVVLDLPFPPRGDALTDTVVFDDRDGVRWLVYVEATPPMRGAGFWQRTTMPGRVTRFDTAMESRVSAERPAGTPYLPEPQLQSLLDESRPLASASTGRPLDALRTATRLGF
jgi:hypothetical protein